MKIIRFLCYVIVAASLFCGCKKESPVVKKDFSKLFNDGKVKADSLLTVNADLFKKISSLHPSGVTVANQGSASQLKSAENSGYPGQVFRLETYATLNGGTYLYTVTYYYYDNLSRLYEEIILTNPNNTGNFSLSGALFYTYSTDPSYPYDIAEKDYYDQNWSLVSKQKFEYSDPSDGTKISAVIKSDNNDYSVLFTSFNYDLTGQLQSTENWPLPSGNLTRTEYSYDALGNIIRIFWHDVNGPNRTLGMFLYTNGQLSTSRIYSISATRNFLVNSTYVSYSPNPIVICYNNLQSDGSFETATLYRYDLTKNGNYFDPLNPIDPHLLNF